MTADELAQVHDARDRTLALVTARLHRLTDLELELLQEALDAGPFDLAACIACMTNLCAELFEIVAEHRNLDPADYWQAFAARLVAIQEP